MTYAAFSDATIEEITREIWSAMVDERHSLEYRTKPSEENGVAGSVAISGSWNGTFNLWFSTSAASQAAARMFGLDSTELTDADVLDAVGELVNIIGGNLKGLLPHPAFLSLPTVHEDIAAEAVLGDPRDVVEMRFAWLDEPILVSIHPDAELEPEM